MKLTWYPYGANRGAQDSSSRLYVISYSKHTNTFRLWNDELCRFGNAQQLPAGLTVEEENQYMETIWRMEG